MNQLCPTNVIDPEWSEARARLDAYLKAVGLADGGRRERIISAVLRDVATRYAQDLGASSTGLAMTELFELSDRWLRNALPPSERASGNGLVCLLAVDAPKKWPQAFLADEIPANLARGLRECNVGAAPDLSVSRMVPQPFDSPLADLNLPSALGKLTKDLSPSMVAKVITVVLSGLAFIFSGNRMK